MSFLNSVPSNGNPFDLGVDGLLRSDTELGLDDSWAAIPEQRDVMGAELIDLTTLEVTEETWVSALNLPGL